MIVDILLSGMAVARQTERREGCLPVTLYGSFWTGIIQTIFLRKFTPT
ncbi:MAG: hypothetical protein ACLSB9_04795 [Hydrogeniiclostridium mannosilyticum]